MSHSHRNKRFKLSQRGMMATLISAALSQSALANTGLVYFAFGNIVVTDANGQQHKLVKGAEVRSGDKIASGDDGRAQIKFSDGAFVSLQPNTQFDIKEYRFNGKADGTESALFGLFKGAMRTITGLVGHLDHTKYQITTATATIGIRGTGGLISIGGDGSTLIAGTSGIWSLTNPGGTIDVPAGTAGLAGANINVPPKLVSEGPVIPPPPAPQIQPTIVQGDVVNGYGGPVTLFPQPLISGPGYQGAVVASSLTLLSVLAISPITSTTAAFNSSGQMTSFTVVSPTGGSTTYTLGGAGSTADFGTIDGVLAWGRWIGPVQVNGVPTTTLSANDGLHYVVGLPTPVTSEQVGTFTYNLIGATSPTLTNGTAAPGVLNSASLVGTFTGIGTGSVTVSLSATVGGNTYAPTGVSGSISGANFTVTNAFFFPAPSSCSSCALTVNGFFSGTGASHAGMVYQINSFGTPVLSGAAAFKR